jgi:uncharacterized membrane protein YtjA (UPF0391 family)
MWYYAAAFLALAALAEVLGLGGIPQKAVEIENILFTGLLLAFIAIVVRRLGRR